MKKLALSLCALLVVSVLLLSACVQEAPAPAPTPTPTPTPTPAPTPTPEAKVLKLGLSTPLTGFGATWGIYCLRSAEILIEQYNNAGGINIGGEKYQIELTYYDDRYDATEGAIICNRLLYEDEVDVFTVFSGGAATAATDITNKAGRFQFGTSFAEGEPSPDAPMAFARNIRYPEVVSAGLVWMAENHPDWKKVACLGPNNPYGQMAQKMTENWSSELAFEVVATELYEPATSDFTPILLKLVALSPDVIDITASSPDATAQIVKQVRELGYTGPIQHWSGPNLQVGVEVAGAEAMEGVLGGTEWGKPYTPEQQALIDAYLAKYGPPFITYTLTMHVGHQVLFQALEKAGTWDADILTETIRNGVFDTVAGKTRFGGAAWYGIDNQILFPFQIATFKDGDIMRVASAETGSYPKK